jgi:predicted permease
MFNKKKNFNNFKLIFIFLDHFLFTNIKNNFFKNIYIILIYFLIKNTLKNNYYYNIKRVLRD